MTHSIKSNIPKVRISLGCPNNLAACIFYFCSEVHVGKVGMKLLIQFPLFCPRCFDSNSQINSASNSYRGIENADRTKSCQVVKVQSLL